VIRREASWVTRESVRLIRRNKEAHRKLDARRSFSLATYSQNGKKKRKRVKTMMDAYPARAVVEKGNIELVSTANQLRLAQSKACSRFTIILAGFMTLLGKSEITISQRAGFNLPWCGSCQKP